MSYSKLMADGMMRSINSAIITLWDSANFLLQGSPQQKKFALKRLELVKEGLEDIKNDGKVGWYEEHLRLYYHYEFKLSELEKFYQHIKKSSNDAGELKKIIGELKVKSDEIQEKYEQFIYKPIPAGASF